MKKDKTTLPLGNQTSRANGAPNLAAPAAQPRAAIAAPNLAASAAQPRRVSGATSPPSGGPNFHFLTFEGEEGTGKSTHIRLLAERLRSLGHEVVTTREPGGTPLCEAIRGLLQYDSCGEAPVPAAETLLFCASRAQLIEKVIRPALERGAWVLSDRFYDSTYAYQGYGRGFDLSQLRAIMAFAIGGVRPALTFLLDADPATEGARLADRFAAGQAADRFEREADDFHARVREGFRRLAEEEPDRIKIVRTDGPVEAAAEAIWAAASRHLDR
jgi:dTMP kinase